MYSKMHLTYAVLWKLTFGNSYFHCMIVFQQVKIRHSFQHLILLFSLETDVCVYFTGFISTVREVSTERINKDFRWFANIILQFFLLLRYFLFSFFFNPTNYSFSLLPHWLKHRFSRPPPPREEANICISVVEVAFRRKMQFSILTVSKINKCTRCM